VWAGGAFEKALLVTAARTVADSSTFTSVEEKEGQER
jgi:hypothetical protein